MSLKSKAIAYVKEKSIILEEKGIKVVIDWDNETIKEDGIMVGGMFDSNSMKLSVALGGPVKEWLPLFIHESQHAEQFLAKSKAWMDICNIYKKQDALSVVFNWIEGTYYPDAIVYKSIRAVQKIELDAEMKTVKEIKARDFDQWIDTDKYIQAANSYIYFYNLIYINRKWYGDNFTEDKHINKLMPTHFKNDYTKIPLDYYRACMKYCYK